MNNNKLLNEIIIEYIKKEKEIKNIYDKIPFELIKEAFNYWKNNIFDKLNYTILDENDDDFNDKFNIFDKLVIFNITNNLDINDLIYNLNINNYILNKYFLYLLKNKNQIHDKIMDNMKDILLKINIYEIELNNNSEPLTDILLNSRDDISLYILEKINYLSIEEKDFYDKEINIKYNLFKSFTNKCNHLYKKYDRNKNIYPNIVDKVKIKILTDLQNRKINFSFLKTLIEEDKEFENKIKLITLEEKEAYILYNKLNEIFNYCQKNINIIENIIDYYTSFYHITKEEIISQLKQKQKEYKEDMKLNKLTNVDIKTFFSIKNFYIDEAKEESKNIKYKNSLFFMIIYRNNYMKGKSKKSEDKIFKETINDYKNIIKEIIEKLELKQSLSVFNNIELIHEVAMNPEFDWNKEINLIKEEFKFLNKNGYIENNLKNDFIMLVEKIQFLKLIEGIINFIKCNNYFYEKKQITCFDNLRMIYNSIISNDINKGNIDKYINLLKSNEYYINNNDTLIQFYKLLLEQKESLLFLNDLKKNLFTDNKNQSEINTILSIYIFFKKILNDKEIKTDKDFLNKFDEEIEKNNNFRNNLNEFKKKYFTSIKKELPNKIEKKPIVNNNKINSTNNVQKEEKKSSKANNIINMNLSLNQLIIIFSYNCNSILIQCNFNEKMKEIIDRFIIKSLADKNSIYFLYGGNVVNEESYLSEIISSEDKRRNQMNILVNTLNDNQNTDNNSIIKSKEVICPKCFEDINIKIKNYKISLSECKNHHSINDILFKDFTNIQNIDIKKIVCNNCYNNNKYESYNNQFYKCLTCEKNICVLCKSLHDKSHCIIDYDKRNSICKEHSEPYNSYCKNCKINLCMKCEIIHKKHKKVYYGNILPDSKEIQKKKENMKIYINQINKDIENIINRLNEFKNNINNYYKIYTDILQNVENQNRNYEILNNIYEINNNDIIKNMKYIAEEKKLKNKVDLILDITDKIGKINDDEITLIYKINKNNKTIKIFDSEFVNNNKTICKIIHENKEIELKEFLDIDPKKEKLIIKLKGIKSIINISNMFYGCDALESMSDFIKWDLSK